MTNPTNIIVFYKSELIILSILSFKKVNTSIRVFYNYFLDILVDKTISIIEEDGREEN